MRHLLLVMALLFSSVVFAAPYDARITWSAPVATEAGDALPEANIASYTTQLTYPDGTRLSASTISPNKEAVWSLAGGAGVYVFTLMAVDVDGLVSAPVSVSYTHEDVKSPPSFDGKVLTIELLCPSNDCKVAVE